MSDESVYQRLRTEIVGGRLGAGARLVTADLAQRFGSSTNPVREALQQLRGEGLVEILPNRGARVRKLGVDYVRDISEIEAQLEPYLVRVFVRIAQPSDIARLDDLQARMEQNDFRDARLHHALDRDFHSVFYDAHYNRQAEELWKRHRAMLDAVGHHFPVSARRKVQIIEDHRDLIAAVRAGNEELSAKIVERHVLGSGLHLIEQLTRQERQNAAAEAAQ